MYENINKRQSQNQELNSKSKYNRIGIQKADNLYLNDEFDHVNDFFADEFEKPDNENAVDYLTKRKFEKQYSTGTVNNTGIPTSLKIEFEELSGICLDDVRVNYDSAEPKKLNALAYTKGNQVYIGHGQENYLEHEIGHVIQQKLGIVKPTLQSNGMYINDDRNLENNADNFLNYSAQNLNSNLSSDKNINGDVIQGLFIEISGEIKTTQQIIDILTVDKAKWGKLCENYPNIIDFIQFYNNTLNFFDEEFCKIYFYQGYFLNQYQQFIVEKHVSKEDFDEKPASELTKLHFSNVSSVKKRNTHVNWLVQDSSTHKFHLYLAWDGAMRFEKHKGKYILVKCNKISDEANKELTMQDYSLNDIESVVTDGVSTCTVIMVCNQNKSSIAIMHLDAHADVPDGYITTDMTFAFVSKIDGTVEKMKVQKIQAMGVRRLMIFDRGMPSTIAATSHNLIGLSFSGSEPQMISQIGDDRAEELFEQYFLRSTELPKLLTIYVKNYVLIYDQLVKLIKEPTLGIIIHKIGKNDIMPSVIELYKSLNLDNLKGNLSAFIEKSAKMMNIFLMLDTTVRPLIATDKNLYCNWEGHYFEQIILFISKMNTIISNFGPEIRRKVNFGIAPWVLEELKLPISFEKLVEKIGIISRTKTVSEPLYDFISKEKPKNDIE